MSRRCSREREIDASLRTPISCVHSDDLEPAERTAPDRPASVYARTLIHHSLIPHICYCNVPVPSPECQSSSTCTPIRECQQQATITSNAATSPSTFISDLAHTTLSGMSGVEWMRGTVFENINSMCPTRSYKLNSRRDASKTNNKKGVDALTSVSFNYLRQTLIRDLIIHSLMHELVLREYQTTAYWPEGRLSALMHQKWEWLEAYLEVWQSRSRKVSHARFCWSECFQASRPGECTT